LASDSTKDFRKVLRTHASVAKQYDLVLAEWPKGSDALWMCQHLIPVTKLINVITTLLLLLLLPKYYPHTYYDNNKED